MVCVPLIRGFTTVGLCRVILVGSRGQCFLRLACIVLSLSVVGPRRAAGSESRVSETASLDGKASNSYCGLYCLYAVTKLSGLEMDFPELVKPEYIGSRKGSSLAELKRASEDSGMYAVMLGRLTTRMLRHCRHPVILHVRSTIESEQYDHYALFLGMEGGKAKLFDPPGTVRLVPFSEIAARWDGNGLLVSAEPISLRPLLAWGRNRFGAYAAVAVIMILIVNRMKRWVPRGMADSWRRGLGLSAAQSTVLGAVALFCGMLYHSAGDSGILAHRDAAALIQQAHSGDFIPKIGKTTVRKLLDANTIFIDARLREDYRAGHLDGAISVPVDANDAQRREITAYLPKDSRIVVYCQSKGCLFAEKVTLRMKDDGFSKVSIYRGGWNEWIAGNGDKVTGDKP